MKNESYYRDLKVRLERLPHGERTALINSAANMLGVSSMTIYRNLKLVGYDAGRKKRSDKGDSDITLDELKIIASLIRQSHRQNAKQLLSIKKAIEVAFNTGRIKAMYNEGTVGRLLRENQLSTRLMQQATPHVKIKTAHPNEQWQLDPSFCVLYYLKDGKGMAVMDKDKFYKNKPQNFGKIANDRVLRYVVTDHCSGAFYCKYYLTPGENREVLFDFLITAMSEKDKQMNPFEGVPKTLYWDLGTANQSPLIGNLLDQLGVKHSAHIKGNSRAKGQVEKTNDIIEKEFEGILYLGQHNIKSIDDLNERVEQWQRYFQTNPRNAHSRHKMPRFTAWRMIAHDQLISCPPVEVCQMLLTDKPHERKVKGDYNIHFEGRKYNLSGVDNIAIGGKVVINVNPYEYPNIRVTHADRFGADVVYDIEPLTQDKFGFDSDAHHASAMTDGHYHVAKLTQADINRQDLDELAYGTRDAQEVDKIRNKKSKVAFDGEIDPFTYIAEANEKQAKATLQPMPKRGKPLDVGEPALQKIRTKKPSLENIKRNEEALPVLKFIQYFVKNHGKHEGMADRIRTACGTHVKESEYETIAQQLLNPTPQNDTQPQPRNLKVM